MSFHFVDHTADARAECTGSTFAELLESAANALYAITLTKHLDGASEERLIQVTGSSREDAFIRWLQELNFLLDVEHFVAAAFRFVKVSEQEIEAVASGYLCKSEERAEEVKSATYQQLAIRESSEGFTAQVTFDL